MRKITIIKRIENYFVSYKTQTKAMKASKLEKSSMELIIDCQQEILRLNKKIKMLINKCKKKDDKNN